MPAPAPLASYRDARPYSRHRLVVRTVLAAEWAVLAVAAMYFGGRALPRAWRHLNTDFPNYYVTARLLREGYNTSRIYEWIWLQRQKDHMGIRRGDQPVVGFVPHTPFSALVMWPLTFWPPLAAKHIWIVFNLMLLAAVAVLLRSLTQLPWRRLALIIGLSYPLLRNLEYGQYYLVLLFLITSALSLHVRGRSFTAGTLLGVAAGLKIFPGFFLLYFARKRDAKAALGLIAGAVTTVVASVWTFGLELHRTYLTQVLPWALRGDAMNPYSLGLPSLSSLLHRLLLFEADWNPHPLVNAPVVFSILLPLLQTAVLVPAVYLTIPRNRHPEQIQLEWSAFVVALLAISTLPASYHFTLLILPAATLAALFIRRQAWKPLLLLMILYLAIGFPAWPEIDASAWWTLLGVPRLYCVLLLCLLCYATLLPDARGGHERRIDQSVWAVGLAVALLVQIVTTLDYQRGIHNEDHAHVSTSPDVLLATEPVFFNDTVGFIGMRTDAYVAGSAGESEGQTQTAAADQLSQTAFAKTLWTENAGTTSQIVKHTLDRQEKAVEVQDAEFPVASPDGRWLAYLRSNKGNASMWLHSLTETSRQDVQITPAQFDVEEMSFLPNGSLIFAASKHGHGSALYMVVLSGEVHELRIANARYPAASPDGRWLIYSRLEGGVWKLRLRDLQGGTDGRITNADCNNISPAWSPDSKRIIYASDCGRGLWFTGLRERQIVP